MPARFPRWIDAEQLPELRDRSDAVLSDAAVGGVLKALYAVRGESADAPLVAAFVAPASGSAFARALFAAWRDADYPATDRWCLFALALWPDDGAVRALAEAFERWWGGGVAPRREWAIETLARMGTDAALGALAGYARQGSGSARDALDRIGADRGVDPASFEAFMPQGVPDYGADDDGVASFPFAAGVEARIRMTQGATKPLWRIGDRIAKRAPAGLAKADPDRMSAFRSYRRQIDAALTHQRLLFERSFLDPRGVPFAAWRAGYPAHPWLRHHARGLVWQVGDEWVGLTSDRLVPSTAARCRCATAIGCGSPTPSTWIRATASCGGTGCSSARRPRPSPSSIVPCTSPTTPT